MDTRTAHIPQVARVRGWSLFAVGMTVFAAVASREHHSTENARDAAALAATSRSRRANPRASDPSLAMQLALVAYRLWQTPDARSALMDATAGEMPTRLLGPPGKTGLALGDDGHRVAIAYQATRAGEALLAEVRAAHSGWRPSPPVRARLASIRSRSATTATCWPSATAPGAWRSGASASPRHPKQLATLRAGTGAVHGLSFSPAGAALAAADADGSVQRWSLADRRQPAAAPPLVAPGRPALQAVSYSHTGNTLTAAGRSRGALVIWPAHGVAAVRLPSPRPAAQR